VTRKNALPLNEGMLLKKNEEKCASRASHKIIKMETNEDTGLPTL
jgi:hypothetical protein